MSLNLAKHKARQQTYDSIKLLRQNETVIIDGKKVEPFDVAVDYGYAEVLCKLGSKIRFAMVVWKDAGPNPRLYDGSGYFVNKHKIYGVVRN